MNALRGNMASQERTCAYIIRRWEQAKAWRWNKLNLGLPRGSESNMALPDFGDGRGTRGVRGDLMLEVITSECVCSPVYPSELSAPALVKQTAETRLGIFLSRISIGRLFLWTLWSIGVLRWDSRVAMWQEGHLLDAGISGTQFLRLRSLTRGNKTAEEGHQNAWS